MRVQQLKYILKVAEVGSITEAAKLLFISQPSLYNSIKETEKEAGITIFLRSRNGITLTNKSLCRMLYSESIFCVLNALVPGVILGIAILFFINLSIRKAFPVLYHIPWAALFGGIFVLIGIVFFITRTEIHKLRDKSIIDEIRMDIV